MPQETTQPHYQHHVGSSSQVQSFEQQSFRPPGVQPTQLFGYRDQSHMSFQSSFHQPPFNYSTFLSQQQLFVDPSNSFATSTMTPPSAYNPMSFMQYYRPTMPSQVSANQSDDNEIEGTDDDCR